MPDRIAMIDAAILVAVARRNRRYDNIAAALPGQFGSLPGQTRTTAAPTVPSPAIPIRNASAISRGALRSIDDIRIARLTPRGKRNHIVRLRRRAGEKPLDVPRGLPDAVFVLDQGETNKVVAVLAEADTRRHCDIRLLDQQLREFERPEVPERFGDRSPSEHRSQPAPGYASRRARKNRP